MKNRGSSNNSRCNISNINNNRSNSRRFCCPGHNIYHIDNGYDDDDDDDDDDDGGHIDNKDNNDDDNNIHEMGIDLTLSLLPFSNS